MLDQGCHGWNTLVSGSAGGSLYVWMLGLCPQHPRRWRNLGDTLPGGYVAEERGHAQREVPCQG